MASPARQGSSGRSGAQPSPARLTSRNRTASASGAAHPATSGKDFSSDPDVLATRNADATQRALVIANRVGADGTIVCPGCGKAAPHGKFKIHPDGGWKHFSSDGCYGDAITVLTNTVADLRFRDAVNALVGKPTSVKLEVPDTLPDLAMFKSFKAKVDVEVFNGILIYGQKTGGVQAAQEFYGTWHISPEVVESSGAVYITDPKHFRENILKRFGLDRLVACGLFVISANGRPVCLLNEKWPVAEPHRHPGNGNVLNIQFRASHAQYKLYLRHKAGELPFDGNQKFVNLKGALPTAQVGAGLDLIDKLPPGSEVRIVEGFKDSLAARTMGRNAFGIPGVDHRPSDKVCQLLARHRVIVALDGDDAGHKGMYGVDEVDEKTGQRKVKEGLIDYLHRKGVKHIDVQPLTGGKDVTDLLVEWHATGGAPARAGKGPCDCATCVTYRDKHPDLTLILP